MLDFRASSEINTESVKSLIWTLSCILWLLADRAATSELALGTLMNFVLGR